MRLLSADTRADGWTLHENKGGFVAQHNHTIMVTGGEPVIFTAQKRDLGLIIIYLFQVAF